MVLKFFAISMVVLYFYFTFMDATPSLIYQKMANKDLKQHWCGDWLDLVLQLSCLKYPEPDKRSYSDYLQALKNIEKHSDDSTYQQHYPLILQLEDKRTSDLKYKKSNDGNIYQECCANPCSQKYIETYYCENN